MSKERGYLPADPSFDLFFRNGESGRCCIGDSCWYDYFEKLIACCISAAFTFLCGELDYRRGDARREVACEPRAKCG